MGVSSVGANQALKYQLAMQQGLYNRPKFKLTCSGPFCTNEEEFEIPHNWYCCQTCIDWWMKFPNWREFKI